jgi:hypothetical protein
MPSTWWEGQKPKTKFAPHFRVPIYYAKDGGKDMIEGLATFCREMESTIIANEELVSSVPKNNTDPYKYTQQWKQHHLFDDSIPRKGGDTIVERFPENNYCRELFDLIRYHYLLHLKNLGFPRKRVWIHAWANVLRKDENISRHMHLADEFAYLSGTYYVTTSNAGLELQNPIRVQETSIIANEAGNIILFPSWIPHLSQKYTGPEDRISIAFDIVADENARANPWRPHELFDDPDQMPGLDF